MTNFLFDSNILVKALYPSPREQKILSQAIKTNCAYISTIILAEVLTRRTKKEREKIELIIPSLIIIDVNEPIARLAARLREQSLKSHKAYLQDCLIAATAIKHSLTLVTHNTRDFRFPHLKLKKL